MIPATRASQSSFLWPFSRVIGSCVCNSNVFSQHVRGKKKKFRPPLDPHYADNLPEIQLVSDSSKPDKIVYVWGIASHGGLGRSSFVRPEISKQKPLHYIQKPHRLGFGEYYEVCDLACGYGFTVFATKSSGVSCFGTGLNSDSQLGKHEPRRNHPLGMLIAPGPIEIPMPSDAQVKKVACGRAHTVMLTDKAGVWTVGNNAYGQCGRPIITDEDYSKYPVFHRLKELDEKKIKQIECGQDTSFFLSEDGVVYSCGWSADGQTGRGHYDNEPNVGPVVGDIIGENIVKISSRADCALAINDKGDVFGWGNNEYLQLNSVTEEMQVNESRQLKFPDIGRIVDVASAGTMCLVLNDSGEVFTWGFGLLGNGPNELYSLTPMQIPSTLFGKTPLTPDAKVVSVYCGINSVAAVNNHNSLFTWGKNPGGCLGLGHQKDQYFPFRVSLAGRILKVSCGVDHMAVLIKEIL